MRLSIAITCLIIILPLFSTGQGRLYLRHKTSHKSVKIKKAHEVVLTTSAPEPVGGDMLSFTDSSLTLRTYTSELSPERRDTTILFAAIRKVRYAKHPESGFIGGLMWYGGILGPLSLAGGTVNAFSRNEDDRQAGYVFIGLGVLLTSGAVYSLLETGQSEYDLQTNWTLVTR